MYDTPEFQSLRREYLQGAVARIGQLTEAAAALRCGAPVDLKQLRQEIHKLRGSGGFYGFHTLSHAAAEAEEALVLILDGERARDDLQIASLVDRVVQALEAAAAAKP